MAPKKPSPTATRDAFLKELEAFMKESDMYPTRFGTEAVGDSRFIPRLRAGNDIMASTMDRCRRFIWDWKKKNAGA